MDPTVVTTGDWLAGAGAVLCAALAWLAYFRWKDHEPEPLRLVAASFLVGAASTGLVIVAYAVAAHLGLPSYDTRDPWKLFLFCVLLVGPIEEGAKFIAAWAVPFRSRHFDEEIDGLVYSTAVALGFASVENFLYFPQMSWGWRIARVVSTPLAHAVFSSVWGYGYSWARFGGGNRFQRTGCILGTFFLAALLHGLYDDLVLAHDATPIAAGVVLLLWIALVLRARGIAERLHRRAYLARAHAYRG